MSFHSLAIETTADDDRNFDSWVERLKNQAFSKGISEGTIDSAFFSVQPLSMSASGSLTSKTDSVEPESHLSSQRVALNKQLLTHFKDILFEIKHLFGVDEEVIIAIWSLDAQLSKSAPSYSAIDVLANLSYQQPTNKKLQNELFAALKIIDNGFVTANDLKSDVTGNIGSISFKPTQFKNFAIDFDGDGTTDLWKSHADIFASTANFLNSIGWKANQPWGMQVKIPEGFDKSLISVTSQRALTKWHELGIRMTNGSDLVTSNAMASLVQLDEASEEYFLVLDNYFTLLRWKRSPRFAIATGMMIDKIRNREYAMPLTPFAEYAD